MDDIATWLEDLGLGQHTELFRANDITAAVLPELTDADLTALGLSLGHRRLLLRAIRDRWQQPAAADAARDASPPGAAAEPARPEAERRQLTVMFVDLAGSTELSRRLDPEDMGATVAGYQNACSEVIRRYEGHTAKYMGDGVLAYFGWPRAHEDDAERAVRAGLDLARAVGALTASDGTRLAARIGIATGQVVVGELIGEGAAQEEAVVGATPNLAARLQALAQPGGVVIGRRTRRLVGGLFELTELAPQRLKGFAEPVKAWRVVGESTAEGRFEALHGAHLTPLVGREPELAILLERWAWARERDGQVVLISGEPGIGKSRLIRSLRERLADQVYTPLSHYCSPYHTNSALYPVIGLLERAARIERDDSPEERLAKLEAVLARSSDALETVVPLLAALLGLPTGERYPPLALAPEVQKRRTLQAMLDQLAGLAAQGPVLALYEDVHWIDPSTLEFLGLVIERIRPLPVLVLVTLRPEFQPPWSGQAHVTTLTMGRLGRRQGADLVARVSGDKPLPAEIVEQIVARTDGVPLFVEELTKTVLESGLLTDAGDHYELSGPLPPLAIPSTLHDSLMARLDRLAPVKEVAQIGAAIGREFSHELLAAVAPMSANLLNDAVEQLVSSELVFRRGQSPEATYSFKHALVQDAAYQSLLKSKRQQLHARIAQALEERSAEVGATGPEVLARHLTDAGLPERAIPYWRRAGELAAGRSANLEATAQLGKALELIAGLPDAPEQLEEELALRLTIGGPLIATRSEAAPEVESTYRRAWALCEQLGRSDELFPVLRGLWHCFFVRGELERAYELAERLVALAEEQRAPLRRALGRRARGSVLFFLGRFTDALAVLGEGVAIDDAAGGWEEHRADLLLYTERAGVVCRLYAGWSLWFLGFPDRASARIEEGVALSQRLAHPHSLAFALSWAAVLHNLRGEFEAARDRAEAAIEIASEHHLPHWREQGIMCQGRALAGIGRQAEGIDRLRAGLSAWNGMGSYILNTQWLGFIAEAHLRAGQLDEALAALDSAQASATQRGECHYQAELWRLRAEILLGAGRGAEAEASLHRAIETARDQEAKSLELRAATSLARLRREQGKADEARGVLAPVYDWFTEGFETVDLKAARALLEELR